MTKLKIEGVHPLLDGEYELDESYFTNRELHAVKKLTGITAGRLEEAFADLDNDVVVALAMVALMRSGKVSSRTPWDSEEVDALWDAKTGKISLDFSGSDEEVPPEIVASEPEKPADESASSDSSGDSSSPVGESQELDLSPTGSPV